MTEVFTITAFNLVVATLISVGGVVLWWILLRLMDGANGVNFSEEVRSWRYPEVYYGLRAIGTALLIGWLVGGRII